MMAIESIRTLCLFGIGLYRTLLAKPGRELKSSSYTANV